MSDTENGDATHGGEVNHRRELPDGGTFGYFIDTDDPDIQQAIEHKVHEAVSEVRADYE